MQALTDPLITAARTSASADDAVPPSWTDSKPSAASTLSRPEPLNARSALRVQVRAALNDLADDMFRSLDLHNEERRRRPSHTGVSQEQAQALHLKAALDAAQQTDAGRVDDGAAPDFECVEREYRREAPISLSDVRASGAAINQLEEQRDLLIRVLRQVTERCELSETEATSLRTALHQADARHAHDAARIEALTTQCQALRTTFEWTRARLDEVEITASEHAAVQGRELDAARAARLANFAALEEETRRSTVLERELASATTRMQAQSEQFLALESANAALQQLLTRIVSGVGEAGERLQQLMDHQKSRINQVRE